MASPGRAEIGVERVEPGGEGWIQVYQPLGGELGPIGFRFRVDLDDAEHPSRELVLRTFVQSAYDAEHPLVDFGDVDRSAGTSKRFELSSREVDTLQVVRVVEHPPFVEITSELPAGGDDQQVTLDLRLLPGAPMGLQSGVIHVQTDLPHQRDYWITFRASVFGDVVPSENPLRLGAIRLGEAIERTVRLTSRTGRAFEIERVEDYGGHLLHEVLPCEDGPRAAACRQLRVTVLASRQGGLRGSLAVWVSGEDEALPIGYSGLVTHPDAKITDLGTLDEQSRLSVDQDGRRVDKKP